MPTEHALSLKSQNITTIRDALADELRRWLSPELSLIAAQGMAEKIYQELAKDRAMDALTGLKRPEVDPVLTPSMWQEMMRKYFAAPLELPDEIMRKEMLTSIDPGRLPGEAAPMMPKGDRIKFGPAYRKIFEQP